MQVGAVFPQLEIGTDPDAIAEYARTVEALGYDHLVIFDHVLGADASRPGGWTGAYDHRSMFHEPFVLYGYMAAVTTRLRLATAVIVLPQRQTALVAKQAAEVDVLTGGRFRLGVGIGWNAVEYEALNESFTNRGRRIEEQIAVMRALWTQEVVDFKGRWHRIDRAGLDPLPVQRPIPIWMGGGWDRQKRALVEPSARRIARIADGWFTHVPANEDSRAVMQAFRRLVEEELQIQGAGVRQRDHEAGQGPASAAHHDMAEVRPIDLPLLARERLQTQERLADLRTQAGNCSPQLNDTTAIAAIGNHLMDASRPQPGMLI